MEPAVLLRALRRTTGMSQRAFAAHTGVPLSTIARIEAGRVNPRFDTMVGMFAAAGYITVVADRQGRPLPCEDWHDAMLDGAGRRFPAHLNAYAVSSMLDEWWGRHCRAWGGRNPTPPRFTYHRRVAFRSPRAARPPDFPGSPAAGTVGHVTWFDVPPGSPFGVANLPFGLYSAGRDGGRHPCVRLGDHVLDLWTALRNTMFLEPTLNAFLAEGPSTWRAIREQLTELLVDERCRPHVVGAFRPLSAVRLHRPIDVGDYVDFYASEHHASNVGRILRPDGDALTPNWKHLPIGYHGRSGTIVVSGTPVVRPHGQRRTADGPVFGPTGRLDIEAEVGFVVGVGSDRPIGVDEFREHVFGVCLVNDWSARDIQAWEYQPLGPFLGKSFATSISPWIVPLDALDAAWIDPPPREVPVLPYLSGASAGGRGLAIDLDVRLNGTTISRPGFDAMYWTPAQMLAHMTVNGATTRTGDLYASGTVSGPARSQRGCLLELTWGGAEPLTLADGTTRTFLEDGDEVIIGATAPGPDGTRIGFGEVAGRVAAAREP